LDEIVEHSLRQAALQDEVKPYIVLCVTGRVG
jgi:hypothetical protein